MSLIVKILLLSSSLLLTLSIPATDKTQYFAHVSFNSTLQLIHGISSNLQKLLKYANGTAIIGMLRIPRRFKVSEYPFKQNRSMLKTRQY